MDLSSPTLTTNSPLTPVFGDVPDILGTGILHLNPSAIITVNSTADAVDDLKSGMTTLRDAINQANADTGSDLIVFDRSVFASAQTITLSLGELDITHNLSIIAPRDPLTGADLVTVSGNKASRVFEIGTEATVNFSGLIVADGTVMDDNGGGIKNSGTLTLDNSIIRNNSANFNGFLGRNFTNGNGGGIDNSGTITVDNSTISGNSAIVGGGIFNNQKSGLGSTVEISNSTISGNSAYVGGGIFSGLLTGIPNTNAQVSLTSTVVVKNSTFTSNSASYGGGIYNGGAATLTISNSIINGNSAFNGPGGGISNGDVFTRGNISYPSTVEINNSTLSANSAGVGGGIYGSSGSVEVNNSIINGNTAAFNGGGISNNGGILKLSTSTISDNSTAFQLLGGSNGGGIFNGFGTVFVSNSTISGNSASNNGGGIYNSGTVTLVFSTLTGNQADNGGGVFNDPGSVNVRNTIIADNFFNSTDSVNPDVSGTFTSNGYNLIGDSTGSTGFGSPGDIVGTSDNPIDPRLAPLDFYGGSTQTIALLPDSPAIDAGDPTVLDTDPTTDQRGLDRVSNGRADPRGV